MEATDRGVGQNFKKVGSQYKGVLHNIGGVRNPLLEKGCSDSLRKILETTCEGVHFY